MKAVRTPLHYDLPQHQQRTGGTLRLLSYNIQAASATARYRQYVTHGWKQVLPHPEQSAVLDGIAELVRGYDVVGLQEADAGSLRSAFINQTSYLAWRAGFPYSYHQPNRKLGKIACASNGLLSRIAPDAIEEHRLPGAIRGRGALWVRYGEGESALVFVIVHLALGRRSRLMQLKAIGARLPEWPRVVLMGDLNAPLTSPEVHAFMQHTGLVAAGAAQHTFPSWRPQRALDHILVSPDITVEDYCAVNSHLSDHQPISVTLRLPAAAGLSI